MSDKIPFDLINREIDRLLARLQAKGVCACCAAQGLLYRGGALFESVHGSEEAAAVCEDVAHTLRENDVAAPDITTQH